MKNLIFTLAFVSSVTLQSHAQCCPYVDPIEIIPASPLATDSIYVITNVTTPNAGSYLGYEIFAGDATVRIEACYYSGMLTMLQTYIDTINIGVHPAGTQNIVFVAYQSDSDESCNRLDSNEVTGSFTVTENLALQQETKPTFQVYPNPASAGLIYVTTAKNEAFTYQLSNTLGQIVLTGTNNISNEIKVEGLKGLYYLSVITEEGTSTKEVIIQ
jgi:hypothetical protein